MRLFILEFINRSTILLLRFHSVNCYMKYVSQLDVFVKFCFEYVPEVKLIQTASGQEADYNVTYLRQSNKQQSIPLR